ncbi:hypothetical protein BV22DRAFT_737575 [Leucogyrophana mollusca]|uniref:Uncharacterized protein n=1 Tax=Leucogyrophana mollusca TaxID=85980 RepID=A0ACB8B6N6_9AGAM|nr:hypothetical protein BV22DRAFT_737575 [Leucogyrophana mollusca]
MGPRVISSPSTSSWVLGRQLAANSMWTQNGKPDLHSCNRCSGEGPRLWWTCNRVSLPGDSLADLGKLPVMHKGPGKQFRFASRSKPLDLDQGLSICAWLIHGSRESLPPSLLRVDCGASLRTAALVNSSNIHGHYCLCLVGRLRARAGLLFRILPLDSVCPTAMPCLVPRADSS